MKKKARILTALVLIMIMTFGMSLEAFAASTTYDSYIEWRTNLPNITSATGERCTGVQAMGVSDDGDSCFYSIKIDDKDSSAVLYYFPSTTNWKQKVSFTINGLGHANGMTVDTDYIYICVKKTVAPKPVPNNKIVRIKCSYIADLAKNILDGVIDDNYTISLSTYSENYEVMQPMIINPDESERENEPYVPYTDSDISDSIDDSEFSTITRAESTGKFIISKQIKNVTTTDEYNGFVRAEIIGGKFVVSSDPDDTFLVKNNVVYKDASEQDICYKPGYGLFIGRWYGGGDGTSEYYNEAKNVILWADIDGAYETHQGYKCYIPDKIRVNMHDYTEGSVTVYKKFEIESIGITERGNMVATFNVIYTDTYYQNFTNNKTDGIASEKDGDAVYKISKYVNGEKLQFTLS